ncbi:hypothetical protein ACFL0Z_01405 [Patescibacteria group bacterium]
MKKNYVTVMLFLFIAASLVQARDYDSFYKKNKPWPQVLQEKTHLELLLGFSWVTNAKVHFPEGIREIPEYHRDHVDYDRTTPVNQADCEGDIGMQARLSLNPLPVSWLSGIVLGTDLRYWISENYYGQTRYSEGGGSESYVYADLRADLPLLNTIYLGWQQPLSRGSDHIFILEAGVEYLLYDSLDMELEQGWYRYSDYTPHRTISGKLRPRSRFIPYLAFGVQNVPEGIGCLRLLFRGGVDWEGEVEYEGREYSLDFDPAIVEFSLYLGIGWKAWYK